MELVEKLKVPTLENGYIDIITENPNKSNKTMSYRRIISKRKYFSLQRFEVKETYYDMN